MKKLEEVKLCNKDFDDMELTELYAERQVRNWHMNKMKRNIEILKRRKHWLENNMPIYTNEELKQQYEDGLLTEGQYRVSHANRRKAITQRMKEDDRTDYANRLVFHEESIIAYIDEIIAEKLAKQDVPKNLPKRRGYDPRRRVSKYNQNKVNPQRVWKTHEEPKKPPELQHARMRWKKGKKNDNKPLSVMRKMQPIVTWDIERLMLIAKDRGFFTDIAVMAAISEALNITVHGTQKMLESGKLTWSQCIIIGSVFEMTPKEFCDVFLAGYFVEVADGVFRAHVEDTEALLDVPYRAKPKKEEEVDGD